MDQPDDARLAAEQRARVLIDRQLTEAGWAVQDRKSLNLYAAQGVAVRAKSSWQPGTAGWTTCSTSTSRPSA